MCVARWESVKLITVQQEIDFVKCVPEKLVKCKFISISLKQGLVVVKRIMLSDCNNKDLLQEER